MPKRIKGTGHLFKRNGCYYIRSIINGKRITKSLKTKNKAEAEKQLYELKPILEARSKEELAFHVAQAKDIIKKANRIKIEDSWASYLKDSTRPDSSALALKVYKSYWMRFLGKIPSQIDFLDQINDEIVQGFMSSIHEQVSNRTYNKILQVLKLVFCTISPDNNPFQKLKTKRLQSVSKKEFTEEQIADMFALFDDNNFSIMHKAEMKLLFMLGRWTGLRLKDCVLLQWKDVDIKGSIIKTYPFKTIEEDISVIIPIHKTLLKELIDLLRTNEYVLPNVAERYLYNPSGVNKDCMFIIGSAGIISEKKKAGIKRARAICEYGFHSFRHSFVSFCANAGVPMAVVQAIVGHGSPAMTRHYTHIGAETLRAAIDKL